MKKYFVIAGIVLLVSLIATGGILIHNVKKYKKLYQRERENIEAYQEENAGLNGEIRQYKMTIDELYASNDVKDKKIVETMESLKIKNKHILK